MPRHDAKTSTEQGPAAPRALTDLASLALSRVAGNKVYSGNVRTKPEVVNRLLEATMHRSPETHRKVVEGMLASGITPEAIADLYIPEVARRMGTEWEDDVSGFAQVTLGSAHLQSLLRELDDIWDTGHSGIGKDARPMVMVLTIPDAQHTLGAGVLSTQLRRLGCSVRLFAGSAATQDDRDPNTCDAIFISASRSDPPEAITRLVSDLRAGAKTPPPVVLGGSILDVVDNPIDATGVDFVTTDPRQALIHCALPVVLPGDEA